MINIMHTYVNFTNYTLKILAVNCALHLHYIAFTLAVNVELISEIVSSEFWQNLHDITSLSQIACVYISNNLSLNYNPYRFEIHTKILNA